MSLSIGTTPPLTEIVATDGEDGAERKSHIEVCVRIRPLKVGAASSTSFLTEKYGSHVNKYKRATGLGRFPRPNGSNKLHSPRRNIIPGSRSNPSSPQSPGDKNDEAGATYAWNVASQDTVVLNNNSLPGRTSSYTLDHVYGPDASTKDLYDKSSRSRPRRYGWLSRISSGLRTNIHRQNTHHDWNSEATWFDSARH